MTTAAADFAITYRVDRVPDLMFGLTADARVVLVAATDLIHITDPAQQTSLQLVLERIRVDQARIHGELHPPEPGSREALMAELKKLGVKYNVANRMSNRAMHTRFQTAELEDGRLITVTYARGEDGKDYYGLQVEGYGCGGS